MKDRCQHFLQMLLLFLMMFGVVNEFGQILCCSSQREGSRMSDLTFYDMIKKQSKFETWGTKTRSSSTRFNHLLSPPVGEIGSWHIATVSHPPGADPALDWQIWNIGKGKDKDVFFIIHIFEYPSINETHESLLKSLMSITRSGLDYTPQLNAPGDVFILDRMARDNLLVNLSTNRAVDPGARIDFLRRIDEWLVDNWPLMASKQMARDIVSLKVGIRTKSQSVRIGEPLEIFADIRKNDEVLKLKKLPHRFLANPGRISWRNNAYFFIPDQLGMSEITLDIMGPQGEYGRGSITLQVIRR